MGAGVCDDDAQQSTAWMMIRNCDLGADEKNTSSISPNVEHRCYPKGGQFFSTREGVSRSRPPAFLAHPSFTTWITVRPFSSAASHDQGHKGKQNRNENGITYLRYPASQEPCLKLPFLVVHHRHLLVNKQSHLAPASSPHSDRPSDPAYSRSRLC
ncbi:hypothetical protein EJ02DRAFT_6551 [Clathrospora elynae]|uniref:Uncharacterized protein n=1 Tax=Clathrospora elynae TaxID=706981 RepID=A0A6A5T7N2_9PLEO|nr:hypothetical protein EJ02DRAFT_6551 [Clathrospora elynae]